MVKLCQPAGLILICCQGHLTEGNCSISVFPKSRNTEKCSLPDYSYPGKKKVQSSQRNRHSLNNLFKNKFHDTHVKLQVWCTQIALQTFIFQSPAILAFFLNNVFSFGSTTRLILHRCVAAIKKKLILSQLLGSWVKILKPLMKSFERVGPSKQITASLP